MKKPFITGTWILLLALSLPVSSHHSFPGMYDVSQHMMLEGVVSKVWFRNPHSLILLTVSDDDGRLAEWYLELPPAWAMKRFGMTIEIIKLGDGLQVRCNPARSGAKSCGVGESGGFYRPSDGLVYGKDPRETEKENQ